MDITSLTAVELGKKIKAKEISVVEAVKASIAQIEKVEKDVNSFVTLDKEGALKRAEEVQKMIDDGCEVIEPTEQFQKDMEAAAKKVWADDEATKTFDQEAVARIREEAGL